MCWIVRTVHMLESKCSVRTVHMLQMSSGESDPMASGFSVSPDHPSSNVFVTDDETADTKAASK